MCPSAGVVPCLGKLVLTGAFPPQIRRGELGWNYAIKLHFFADTKHWVCILVSWAPTKKNLYFYQITGWSFVKIYTLSIK